MSDIKFDEKNYRRHDERNLNLIKKSLEECGTGRSIVIDKDGGIIAGNATYKNVKELGIPVKIIPTNGKELIALQRTDLSADDEKRKKLALMDNSTSDKVEWDITNLTADFDIDDLAQYGLEEIKSVTSAVDDFQKGTLKEKYLECPFSILDTTSGSWQQRKRAWHGLGIKSEIGREENLLRFSNFINEKGNSKGTSIFDPVLCELAYTWFSKKDDFILDVFAGGSVRGIVASELQRNYLGLELRKEQVEANEQQAQQICENYTPAYLIGDSNKLLDGIEDGKYNMCLSCPPYADLEKYSDDQDDLSNMPYPKFIEIYGSIIKKLYSKLKEDSFVVWVIGEVRDKKGNYYNFLGDTIKCFLNAGFNYYNEIILKSSTGTGALRVGKQFNASRKVVKIHQNVLVFVKGDGKKATQRLGEVEIKEAKEQEDALL